MVRVIRRHMSLLTVSYANHSVPIDEDDGIANKTITDVEGITHTAEEEAGKKVESEENPVACAIELTTLKIPLSFIISDPSSRVFLQCYCQRSNFTHIYN